MATPSHIIQGKDFQHFNAYYKVLFIYAYPLNKVLPNLIRNKFMKCCA
ncbi:MAG: hypothetical protein V7K48_20845 [Nostoc sp.]